jgi:hypothetical protein
MSCATYGIDFGTSASIPPPSAMQSVLAPSGATVRLLGSDIQAKFTQRGEDLNRGYVRTVARYGENKGKLVTISGRLRTIGVRNEVVFAASGRNEYVF